VVTAGRHSEEREAKAKEIANATGYAFVHPFDDPDVIAGQGTCGLEITEQLDDFDTVLVPVGGGGLISGVSIAVKSEAPKARVFGVEPEGAPKLSSALAANEIVRVQNPTSLADGLIPSAVGNLPFEACSRYVDGAFAVSEDQIFSATIAMAKTAHIIAEPSGAAPLSPLIAKSGQIPGNKVVVVVSGGNISTDLLRKVLSS
jgi:threonine dehydratase